MRGLEDRAKLGSRWLGCKVSKDRGLGQQLWGRIRKITYHVSDRDEKGRALQSLASYRARGRSQRLTSGPEAGPRAELFWRRGS